jgi:hypothetical protein
MKIDPSKKYKTRSGRTVEFLHRAPEGWPGEYPWIGIVGGKPQCWMDNGSEFNDATESADDLIEVCEPMRIKLWVKGTERPLRDCDVDAHDISRNGWALKEFVEVMP